MILISTSILMWCNCLLWLDVIEMTVALSEYDVAWPLRRFVLSCDKVVRKADLKVIRRLDRVNVLR